MVDREVDGPVWVVLGRAWDLCVRSWAALGRSWAALGRSWGGLGASLGRSWAALGRSWAILGPSAAILNRLGVALGCIWGRFEFGLDLNGFFYVFWNCLGGRAKTCATSVPNVFSKKIS